MTTTAPRQYLTDEAGNRVAVILPMDEYEALMEDLHDLAVLAEHRDEPTRPLEEVLAGRRKEAVLQS